MKKDFLPIGTVVLLKNATKKIMITGYLPKAKGKVEAYDYSACLFPEGIISNNQTAVFNTEQIAEIIQLGYKNDETEKFVGALNEIVNQENQKNAESGIPKELEPQISEEFVINNQMPEMPTEVSQPMAHENETLDMPNMAGNQQINNQNSMPLENESILDDVQPIQEPNETLDMPQPVTPVVEPAVEENKSLADSVSIPSSFANNEPIGMEAIKPFSE